MCQPDKDIEGLTEEDPCEEDRCEKDRCEKDRCEKDRCEKDLQEEDLAEDFADLARDDLRSAGQGRASDQLDVSASLRTFQLIISYDGSQFFGWQRQSVARTVQATLEDAIADLTGASVVHLLGSSRTDTGVHAIGQCATFRSQLWKWPASRMTLALNVRLPDDVAIRSVTEVPYSFHPIRDAITKRYRYSIYASRVPNPIGRRQAWWVKRRLDIDAMRQASRALIGKHDFISFQTAGSPRVSTVRTVTDIEIAVQDELDGQAVTIEIEADGFLYNMVRSIVGTLVRCGTGHKPVSWVQHVLESRDRKQAGQTAPAQGLCLLRINYGSDRIAQGLTHLNSGK